MEKNFSVPDLVQAYHLYQKMMDHPDTVYLIREIFLNKLEKDGITDAGSIKRKGSPMARSNRHWIISAAFPKEICIFLPMKPRASGSG